MANIILFIIKFLFIGCFLITFAKIVFFISECVSLVCVPMDESVKKKVKLPFSVVKFLIENNDNVIYYTISYSKTHITYREAFYTTIDIYLSLKDYFLYRKFLYVFCKKSENKYFPKNAEIIEDTIDKIKNNKSN